MCGIISTKSWYDAINQSVNHDKMSANIRNAYKSEIQPFSTFFYTLNDIDRYRE